MKGELPELNTTVLCFTGGQMFGQYELGSMIRDEDEIRWRMENDPKSYCVPDAWCNVPDAPDFNECV